MISDKATLAIAWFLTGKINEPELRAEGHGDGGIIVFLQRLHLLMSQEDGAAVVHTGGNVIVQHGLDEDDMQLIDNWVSHGVEGTVPENLYNLAMGIGNGVTVTGGALAEENNVTATEDVLAGATHTAVTEASF